MSDEIMLSLPTDQPLVKATEEDFQAVSKVGDFLPRLQVCGSSTEVVKAGKIPMGHLALVLDKDNPVDVDKEVDCVVLSFRTKALDMTGATPISYFDRTSADFKAIQQVADGPDSKKMFGPEFLIYIPSRQTFATFYMGSKSARKEAPNLLNLMKQAGLEKGVAFGIAKATIRVKFIPKNGPKGYSWHAPQVLPCTTPLTVDVPQEEVIEELQKFNNPKPSVVEKVQDSGSTDTRAR